MSTLQAVIFGMSEQPPTFVARKNPGSGWGVDILWPDGETEVVKGFATDKQAAEWIAKHSEDRVGNTGNRENPAGVNRRGSPR